MGPITSRFFQLDIGIGGSLKAMDKIRGSTQFGGMKGPPYILSPFTEQQS